MTSHRPFLVQFTEHVTYEVELEAQSEEAALLLGCELLASVERTGFVPVETDQTDLTVIPLDLPALNFPQKVSVAMTRDASSRPVTTSDVAVIIKLLEELRDTTLSHGSWEGAKRLIRQFTE